MVCQGVVGSGASLGQAVAAVPTTPVTWFQMAKRMAICAEPAGQGRSQALLSPPDEEDARDAPDLNPV
jgi:hypothetical protein